MIVDNRNKKTSQKQCPSSTKFSEGAISHWKHGGSPDTLTSETSGVDIPKSRPSLSWRGHRDVDIAEEGREGKDRGTFVVTG